MNPILISAQVARRFVLGKQGLWPGRRWKGKKGTAQAIRACEAVQLDPLNITARSHDLVLHSRVLNYKPEYLYQAMYKEREFFDYGGWLAVYPMTSLPYYRFHMQRRSHEKRVEDFVLSNPELFEQVRAELQVHGPLGNRNMNGNKVTGNYRGRKDTSLALFDMWLSGELMIHHREGFERVYDFRENIAPKEYDYVAGEKEAEEFFIRKNISFMGLFREPLLRAALQYDLRYNYSQVGVRQLIGEWLEAGKAQQVQIEGGRDTYLVLAEDLPLLESLQKGKIPRAWKPIDTTTLEEVTLLASLDIVSARGRAKKLFDFDYKWEVYMPAHQRRWGYYVLPILYGDDLVARLDPKLDRTTMTLEIKGFWHEEDAPVKDVEFAEALAKGLVRFAKFLGAKRVDVSVISPAALRRQIKKLLNSSPGSL
ncbi:MAG TPA: crosslink repair DNA glycosylase YcaQ family protein [Anaerolineales bacterium]|nr:crosslink repair DNA glycosylase YcaQ family protein [Anaerolineales bacterium]